MTVDKVLELIANSYMDSYTCEYSLKAIEPVGDYFIGTTNVENVVILFPPVKQLLNLRKLNDSPTKDQLASLVIPHDTDTTD